MEYLLAPSSINHYSQTSKMLRELGVPTHQNGFKQLCIAIPYYSRTNTQCLSKEVYPFVAEYFEQASGVPIERAIRASILYAWVRREQNVWEKYFPGALKVPSNKMFISTLAEYLE